MADGMPEFDLTGMQLYAASSHEMFTSLVESGFTEDQAITMVVRFALEASAAQRSDD